MDDPADETSTPIGDVEEAQGQEMPIPSQVDSDAKSGGCIQSGLFTSSPGNLVWALLFCFIGLTRRERKV